MSLIGVGYQREAMSAVDPGNGPSDSIWAQCPIQDIRNGLTNGTYLFDRFDKAPVLVTPTITTEAVYGGGYKAFGSTGGTILSTAGATTGLGGGLVLLTDGTDNDALSLTQISLPFQTSRGVGSVWFEARLKIKTIAANAQGLFFGLIEQQTTSAIIPIVAAGTMADANFYGFFKNEAAATMNAQYKANGVAAVNIKASAHTFVADTFVKLGAYYNDGAKTLRMYVNGLPVGSAYSMATGNGTDFPNDVPMGLCLAFINGSGASANDTCTLNWWAAAQVYAA